MRMSLIKRAATTIRRAAARSAGTGTVSHFQFRNGEGRVGARPRTVGGGGTHNCSTCRGGLERDSRIGAQPQRKTEDAPMYSVFLCGFAPLRESLLRHGLVSELRPAARWMRSTSAASLVFFSSLKNASASADIFTKYLVISFPRRGFIVRRSSR